MMTIETYLQFANNCLETPFHHQGRKPNIGLDCIGLVICSLNAANSKVNIQDRIGYSRLPSNYELLLAIEAHGVTKFNDLNLANRGDLLVFRFGNQPQHVAIYLGDMQIIHAYQPAGKVIRIPLNNSWKSRFYCGYNLQEIF